MSCLERSVMLAKKRISRKNNRQMMNTIMGTRKLSDWPNRSRSFPVRTN